MLTNKIYQGDALEVLKTFPDECIDMCITSPPYWGLRDYGTAEWDGGDKTCDHMSAKEKSRYDYSLDSSPIQKPTKGTDAPRWKAECPDCGAIKIDEQIGLEETPEEFINNLCDIFDEVKRVLRPHGSCWVNLGDSYANSGVMGKVGEQPRAAKGLAAGRAGTPKGIKTKSLIMIPSRFAIEMINRGWILRNEIIWHKPTCMPSSATDRYTVDFEKLFFFTKESKYYFKQQIEDTKAKTIEPRMVEEKRDVYSAKHKGTHLASSSRTMTRNKRTVWSINPASFKEAHFATYPPKLIESPIDAGCPVDGVVLDPFFGSGTTAEVALNQDKNWVGIELNPAYIEIAEKRLKKPKIAYKTRIKSKKFWG